MDLRRSIAQDIITANIERKSAFAQNLEQLFTLAQLPGDFP